jgi:hypothetical protein
MLSDNTVNANIAGYGGGLSPVSSPRYSAATRSFQRDHCLRWWRVHLNNSAALLNDNIVASNMAMGGRGGGLSYGTAPPH